MSGQFPGCGFRMMKRVSHQDRALPLAVNQTLREGLSTAGFGSGHNQASQKEIPWIDSLSIASRICDGPMTTRVNQQEPRDFSHLLRL